MGVGAEGRASARLCSFRVNGPPLGANGNHVSCLLLPGLPGGARAASWIRGFGVSGARPGCVGTGMHPWVWDRDPPLHSGHLKTPFHAWKGGQQVARSGWGVSVSRGASRLSRPTHVQGGGVGCLGPQCAVAGGAARRHHHGQGHLGLSPACACAEGHTGVSAWGVMPGQVCGRRGHTGQLVFSAAANPAPPAESASRSLLS